MTRRILLVALCFCCVWMCLWAGGSAEPRRVRPEWVVRSWVLVSECAGGHVEARVWFDEGGQRYDWSALRTGRNLPAGPQWRTGASKTSREAKAAAEAAVEELSRD